MFNIVLFEPEIPPNTGNIMRLCANTGTRLHLIKPLGFVLSDKQLRRAGMDYREQAIVTTHEDFESFLATVKPERCIFFTTKTKNRYDQVQYQANDALVFGSETKGLPEKLFTQFPSEQFVTLPMHAESRSLNLSNAAAIATYEAWRQMGFK